MYVCVYVCVYIYVCVFVCIYVYIYIVSGYIVSGFLEFQLQSKINKVTIIHIFYF